MLRLTNFMPTRSQLTSAAHREQKRQSDFEDSFGAGQQAEGRDFVRLIKPETKTHNTKHPRLTSRQALALAVAAQQNKAAVEVGRIEHVAAGPLQHIGRAGAHFGIQVRHFERDRKPQRHRRDENLVRNNPLSGCNRYQRLCFLLPAIIPEKQGLRASGQCRRKPDSLIVFNTPAKIKKGMRDLGLVFNYRVGNAGVTGEAYQ